MDQAIDQVLNQVNEAAPGSTIFQFYRKVSEQLPYFVPAEATHQIMQAIASIDSNTVSLGKKTALFLYLKSIISAVEPFVTNNEDQNNEIIQTAISGVFNNLEKFNPNLPPAQNIYVIAKNEVAQYLATQEEVPASWVKAGLLDFDINFQTPPSNKQLEELATKMSEKLDISYEKAQQYIKDKNNINSPKIDEEGIDKLTEELALKDTLETVLEGIDENPRTVLRMRYLEHNQYPTLKSIATELNISSPRVNQLERIGLSDIRMNRELRNRLRDFLDINGIDSFWFMNSSEIFEEETIKSEPKYSVDLDNPLTILDLSKIAQKYKDVALPKPEFGRNFSGADFIDKPSYLYPRTYHELIQHGIMTIDQLVLLPNDKLLRILDLENRHFRHLRYFDASIEPEAYDVRRYLAYLRGQMKLT
jgi:RNA polymerase sigma factor (sigma-70 family)